MPTVSQMAALGDTLTGSTLLQSANKDYDYPRRSNTLDSMLQNAYSAENAAKSAGLSMDLTSNNKLTTTPENLAGTLMTYKA